MRYATSALSFFMDCCSAQRGPQLQGVVRYGPRDKNCSREGRVYIMHQRLLRGRLDRRHRHVSVSCLPASYRSAHTMRCTAAQRSAPPGQHLKRHITGARHPGTSWAASDARMMAAWAAPGARCGMHGRPAGWQAQQSSWLSSPQAYAAASRMQACSGCMQHMQALAKEGSRI